MREGTSGGAGRRACLVVAVTALLLSAVPPPGHSVAAPPAWTAEGPGIAGFGTYAGGEWVYQDFVYDDGGRANNTADIVEVRVRAAGNDLLLRVTLNSLFDTASTVIGIAVGTPDGEIREWPAGAGVRSAWDRFVTIAGATARITEPGGDEQTLDPPLVDLAENTVEVRVPRAAKGNPTLRLVAGAGQLSGHGWAGRPIDLAFNTHDQEPRVNNFRDSAQQSAIDSGDVSDFHQDVDLARVRDREAIDPPITEPGLYNRVYRSSQDLGGGYAPAGAAGPFGGSVAVRGLYQPYALWIPPGYDPTQEVPLVLVLHSLGQHHNQYSTWSTYDQVAGLSGAVAITPLALGTSGWYWDEALVDTLDAWVDVVEHYSIDPERVYSMGYSMGGYGTYRLATLFPELLAGAVSWVGPPTDGIWLGTTATDPPGLTFNQVPSVLHIPFYIVHGTNDELVPVTGVTRQAQRLHDLGYTYRYALHPGQDHFSFAILDNWAREADWLFGRRRVVDPPQVVFVVRPATWTSRGGQAAATILDHVDRLTERLGARRDGAYWVSDIAVRGTGDVSGSVDLTSHGIAARIPEIVEITTVDAGPPGYGSTLGPTPHLLRGADRTWVDASTENVLSGSLTGVTEATVDLVRAGLRLDGLEIRVDTDGPARLHLVEGDERRTVELG